MALTRMRTGLLLTGILLGVMQTGLFFQLTFTLSSGFGTYLMVTLGWLAGSAVGASLHSRMPSLTLLLGLGYGCYAACALLLVLAPYESTIWPVYAILVMAIGLYPGVYFARMGQLIPAGKLFLWENNGFLAGMAGATVLFMLLGRPVLWLMPALASVVCALLLPRLPHTAVKEPDGTAY